MYTDGALDKLHIVTFFLYMIVLSCKVSYHSYNWWLWQDDTVWSDFSPGDSLVFDLDLRLLFLAFSEKPLAFGCIGIMSEAVAVEVVRGFPVRPVIEQVTTFRGI